MLAARIRNALSRDDRGPIFHVVVPARGHPTPSDAARHLLDAIRNQAASFTGAPVRVIAVDVVERSLWCAESGRPAEIRDFRQGRLSMIMSAGFLLADPPPVAAVLERAERTGIAWCAAASTRDVYAVAFATRRFSRNDLWSVLALLTACVDDRLEPELGRALSTAPIAPAASWVEHSPALTGVAAPTARRAFDSPRFLNTALQEIVNAPRDPGVIARHPRRMADALIRQRATSRVPWIFNALVNEIEYRVGRIEPESFPPEIHLSVTGRCNIECRFCAYEHALARADFVDVDSVARLDFLRFVQTFRLHSGLGEPTLNRHLPLIVEHVASRHPHVGMNFFTNAVRLDGPGLVDALVGNARWINASLNAATRDSWREVSRADLFGRVCDNLRTLHRAKRERRSLLPLVFGSMVLTRANLADLPRMPALCRELGIDRFSAFPYFGLGYDGADKYRGDMTLEACRAEYDQLYWTTVREAEAHGVSLEIPAPSEAKRVTFGMEARPLHDFARIESNEWKLGRFVRTLEYEAAPAAHCQFLWRTAAIGSTHRAGHAADATHYLYPCIGPLSGVDLSRRTAFRFLQADAFLALWRNPVFAVLRRAQREPGVSEVCDVCRGTDTRAPQHFAQLGRLVAEFARRHCGAPSPAGDPPRGSQIGGSST